LAWVLEQAIPYAESLSFPGKTNQDYGSDFWREKALHAYRKAYALRFKMELRNYVFVGQSPLAWEAAEGILRLHQSHKLSLREKREVAWMRKVSNRLNQIPRTITPIIFPLTTAFSYRSLSSNPKPVAFDLLGDGVKRRWSWVTRQAGILVWDPKMTGVIRYGWQLFGARTWYVFWKNGYVPLSALDTSGDGWLSGAELEGIAVWIDHNENGISEKGEVIPLSRLHIVRIRTHGFANGDHVLWNPKGIQLDTGGYLPSYDWVSHTR
jgi:hypothetical protein